MKKLIVVGIIILLVGMSVPVSQGEVINQEDGACLSIYKVFSRFNWIFVEIKDSTPDTYENINWSISLEGGLILKERETNGTIAVIEPNQIVPVISNQIWGIGRIEIKIKIHETKDLGPTTEKYDGFAFFPFVFVENGRSLK